MSNAKGHTTDITNNRIKEWLHGNGLRNTIEDLGEFFKGTSWEGHWIAYDHDIPFAHLLTSQDGEDAITLDLFICDLNYLGKGNQGLLNFYSSTFFMIFY